MHVPCYAHALARAHAHATTHEHTHVGARKRRPTFGALPGFVSSVGDTRRRPTSAAHPSCLPAGALLLVPQVGS